MIHLEHRPFVQGRGRYLDDLGDEDAFHVAFVRSPHAHAMIRAIDPARARSALGVRAVLIREDVAEIRAIAPRMDATDAALYFPTEWWPMACDVVRYVGEIVAMVIAEDRYQAEDAAMLVDVDYDAIPAVASIQSASRDDAPRLHRALPSNLLYENRLGAAADLPLEDRSEPALHHDPFGAAAIHLRTRCAHGRLAGLAMENCGVLARFDAVSKRLEVMTSTQVPHLIRDGLSTCLDIPSDRIRVVAPDVGGGFGVKLHLFPEEVLVAFAAKHLRIAVKWVQDRAENLQASFHAREVTIDAELAADADGRVLGLRVRLGSDVGAYSAFPVTSSLEPQTIGAGVPGPYRWPYYDFIGQAFATNKFPTGAYRGVGFPVGPLVTERLMDALARQLGRDPVEVRRRNLLTATELPYTNPIGATYDSGDYHALLDLAVAKVDYAGWRARQARARRQVRRLGIGISCFIESTGMGELVYRRRGIVHIPGFDSASICVNSDGTLKAAVSTPSQGQSQTTTFRRLLSPLLGVDESIIEIVLGDTDTTPYGSGTFASRSVVSGGGALDSAAKALCAEAKRRAAQLWQVNVSAVRYGEGKVELSGDDGRVISLAELARLSTEDGGAPLQVEARYSVPSPPFACATHIAVVEVDIETGGVKVARYVVVEDCGRMINPPAVDGQIRGAVAQGIGSALLEQHIYDPEGQQLTGTLQDYLVPGTLDIPDIEVYHLESPSPITPGGHKGVGESGIIGAPAAIANAVADALDLSPVSLTLPLTPERVLALAEQLS